jgi:tetratricopeptide (TPR) repeat protein
MRMIPRSRCNAVLVFACAILPGLSIRAQQPVAGDALSQLLLRGSDSMQRGDLAGAEATFRQAIVAAPNLSDAFLGLGLVQLREGEVDEAIRSLGKASTLNPELQGPHLFLGIAQYQSGQSDAANTSLRAELALNPDDLQALTWLGIVALGTDHPEAAVTPLDHAASLKPDDAQVLYYQARAHALVAEDALAKLYKLDPDSALVHRARAENFESSGQPDKAIAEFEAAISKDPGNADLYESLGEADQKLSRLDAAKAAYEQELKLNPHSAIALYNVGRLDVERGDAADGVVLLRQAHAAHASASPTAFYLGLGLAEVGQNAEAAQWLEQSLADQPSAFVEQGAWYQLARVYGKLGRKVDAQNALQHLKQVLDAQQRQKQVTAGVARGSSSPLNDAPAPEKP